MDGSITVSKHYDNLIEEGNDPVYDPPQLKRYMDKWDGECFFHELKLKKNLSVLEIGVGTGRLALKVLELGCKTFTGVDISKKTLDKARINLSSYRNFELLWGDFLEKPFNQAFDVIYTSLTFFHIKNKKMAIEKIWSLLNTSGRFILSIDKEQKESFEYGSLNYGSYQIKLYPDNLENILSLMKEAGFFIENTTETDFAFIISGVRSEHKV